MSVKLGDEVKDTVTGYQGIAVCRHSYLNGCDRITIQPPLSEGDGSKLPEECNFDEPQLTVIRKKVIPIGSKKTGGPDKHPDSRRSTSSRR